MNLGVVSLTHLFKSCLVLLLLTVAQVEGTEPPGKWDKEIGAFLASDKTNPPPSGAILFVGSSSIRMWKSLAQDFPEHQVINRGFGGSHTSDVNLFLDKIVLPYKPKQVLLYGGDNDVASGKTPQQVLKDFQEFVSRVHAKLPQTRIDFISIKPSPSRWHLAAQVKEANRLVQEYTKSHPKLGYIDIFEPMLGPNGEPDPELFISDRLHMNEKGYAIWRRVIAPHLER